MKTNTLTPLASQEPEAGPEAETEAGLYFFTIYTHRQERRLGRVSRRGTRPSALGRTVEAHWHNLSRIFPDIRLDAFTLMPDRIHGIIEIEEGAPHGIAAILRTFKSFSAREINKLQQTPGNMIWQQAHDERILHDAADLEKMQTHIMSAPARWRDGRRQRLNPVSRRRSGAFLNWFLPSFLAAEH